MSQLLIGSQGKGSGALSRSGKYCPPPRGRSLIFAMRHPSRIALIAAPAPLGNSRESHGVNYLMRAACGSVQWDGYLGYHFHLGNIA